MRIHTRHFGLIVSTSQLSVTSQDTSWLIRISFPDFLTKRLWLNFFCHDLPTIYLCMGLSGGRIHREKEQWTFSSCFWEKFLWSEKKKIIKSPPWVLGTCSSSGVITTTNTMWLPATGKWDFSNSLLSREPPFHSLDQKQSSFVGPPVCCPYAVQSSKMPLN